MVSYAGSSLEQQDNIALQIFRRIPKTVQTRPALDAFFALRLPDDF
jgi:hypothetical protein